VVKEGFVEQRLVLRKVVFSSKIRKHLGISMITERLGHGGSPYGGLV
jgi:hypothetical protein